MPPSDQLQEKDLIPLSEAARISGYSMGHLRHLIAKGLLSGRKVGRNYVTTGEALAQYIATNPRPGRKRPQEG